ncbi:unnamed protein product, partial [Nesidiocoris tenuis]
MAGWQGQGSCLVVGLGVNCLLELALGEWVIIYPCPCGSGTKPTRAWMQPKEPVQNPDQRYGEAPERPLSSKL